MRSFLLEYDRTSRIDKNFDKFRRYDNLVSSWWRHTHLADHGQTPYVLFICQDDGLRDDFLARADQELTGHRWHPNHPAAPRQYTGRRHIFFCDERDIHHRHRQVRRLPPYPPDIQRDKGSDAEIRGVRLPAGAPNPARVAAPFPEGNGVAEPVAGRTGRNATLGSGIREAAPGNAEDLSRTQAETESRRPGLQYSRAYRCPPRARSREPTRRSESQMAALAIELPENVLDALAERVAARVLERLEDGQDGDRWLDAKQAADYLGLSINALHKLTAARQLPAEQDAPGHKLWFRRSQLDHWRSGGHNGAFASKTLPQNSQ